MRATPLAAWKDLRQIFRDPVALAAWVTMPALMMVLIMGIFGTGAATPTPQGRLLVADQDKTILSGMLLVLFNGDELRKIVVVEPVSYEEGRQRIDAGDGAALLVIPKGMSADYLNERPVALTLVTNPEYRILPAVVEEALSIELDGAFYLQRLAGGQMRQYRNGLPQGAELEKSVMGSIGAVRRIAVYLNPPLISLKYEAPEPREKAKPFAALFYPGMLVLAVFGFAQAMSERLWRERTSGTLRRWLTTSQTMPAWLMGKILAQALIFALFAAVAFVVLAPLVSAPPHNLWMAMLWTPLCGTGLFLMASVIQLSATEVRAGTVLNAFVLFVLGMAGGTFFPFEMMPGWLAAIGRVTPNGWAIWRLREMIDGPVAPERVLTEAAIALAFCAVLFVYLARRLRRWAV
jgi:ABC-type Na+ efflux pump permease subunit